ESCRSPLCIEGDGIDRSDLLRIAIYGIEEGHDLLFERIGDIEPRKACRFCRVEQAGKPWIRQQIRVHQVVEAIDVGRCKRIGKKRRGQRPHDVRAEQPDEYSAPAHADVSSGARPPPRKSWAMRGSTRIFCAVSSILVWPCSSTIP